jgi:transcription elongation factor Elf1
MPSDRNVDEEEFAKEDKELSATASGRDRRFKDFDCPSCNANNPYDDSFGDGDEILCHYCGTEFKIKVTEEGRLKLKET